MHFILPQSISVRHVFVSSWEETLSLHPSGSLWSKQAVCASEPLINNSEVLHVNGQDEVWTSNRTEMFSCSVELPSLSGLGSASSLFGDQEGRASLKSSCCADVVQINLHSELDLCLDSQASLISVG